MFACEIVLVNVETGYFKLFGTLCIIYVYRMNLCSCILLVHQYAHSASQAQHLERTNWECLWRRRKLSKFGIGTIICLKCVAMFS